MTPDLLDSLKPQLDEMQAMCKAAFEAGRRSAFAEMQPGLKKLQDEIATSHPLTTLLKNEADALINNEADALINNRQGETHDESQKAGD